MEWSCCSIPQEHRSTHPHILHLFTIMICLSHLIILHHVICKKTLLVYTLPPLPINRIHQLATQSAVVVIRCVLFNSSSAYSINCWLLCENICNWWLFLFVLTLCAGQLYYKLIYMIFFDTAITVVT